MRQDCEVLLEYILDTSVFQNVLASFDSISRPTRHGDSQPFLLSHQCDL